MSKIITIGRQFGSGGRELGKRLAEAMGIGYFDREVISEIARKSGLAETYVNNFVEKRAGYYPITIGRTFYAPMTLQMDTEVYRAQTAAIRELAGRGDCVIIGRCADYILEDMHPVNLFVFSDMESRIARCRRKAGSPTSIVHPPVYEDGPQQPASAQAGSGGRENWDR